MTQREYVTLEIAPNSLFLVQRCLTLHKSAVVFIGNAAAQCNLIAD